MSRLPALTVERVFLLLVATAVRAAAKIFAESFLGQELV
jgi:hypothetical protein